MLERKKQRGMLKMNVFVSLFFSTDMHTVVAHMRFKKKTCVVEIKAEQAEIS